MKTLKATAKLIAVVVIMAVGVASIVTLAACTFALECFDRKAAK